MKKLSVVLAALAVSIVGLSGQASATPRPSAVCTSGAYTGYVPLVTGPSGTGTTVGTAFTANLSGFYPSWPVSVVLSKGGSPESSASTTTNGSGGGSVSLTASSNKLHTITATQTLGSGCTLVDTTTVCIENCGGTGLLSGPSGSRFGGLAALLATAAGQSSMPGTAASSVAFDGVVTQSSDSGLASPLQWTLVAAAGGLGIAGVGTLRRRTRRPAPTA